MPILDQLESQLAKSEELQLLRIQQFLELELIKFGIVSAILDEYDFIPTCSSRFFPQLYVNGKGEEQYYVAAEWPHGIGYLPTTETQHLVRVGRELDGQIIEDEDFTPSQVRVVASQIHYLRKKRKRKGLPNLNDNLSKIAA